MPGWARPSDVTFDHAAAAAAAQAVADMRANLTNGWMTTTESAAAALATWAGDAADGFSAVQQTREGTAGARAQELLDLENAILTAQDDATAEQRRIEGLQEAWDAERAAEIRAADQAAAQAQTEAAAAAEQDTGDPEPVPIRGPR